MFRYSIRELALVILAVGLSLGWWLDRSALSTAKLEAAEDARMLSHLTAPNRIGCGNESGYLSQLQEKYGAVYGTAPTFWVDIADTENSTDEASPTSAPLGCASE